MSSKIQHTPFVVATDKNGPLNISIVMGTSFKIVSVPRGAHAFDTILEALNNQDKFTKENLESLILGEDQEPLEAQNKVSMSKDTIKRLFKNITTDGDRIMVDGTPIKGNLSLYILENWAERNDSDWLALSRFLRKSVQNPSPETYSTIFSFIEKNGLALDKKGNILAVKYLTDDMKSSWTGYAVVDGKVYKDSHIPNQIGSIIEFPREEVNSNKNVTCGAGLHVGSLGFMSGMGPNKKYVLVKVDPRDVVVVPDEYDSGKIRVCRYKVVSEISYKDIIEANDKNGTISDLFTATDKAHIWSPNILTYEERKDAPSISIV